MWGRRARGRGGRGRPGCGRGAALRPSLPQTSREPAHRPAFVSRGRARGQLSARWWEVSGGRAEGRRGARSEGRPDGVGARRPREGERSSAPDGDALAAPAGLP